MRLDERAQLELLIKLQSCNVCVDSVGIVCHIGAPDAHDSHYAQMPGQIRETAIRVRRRTVRKMSVPDGFCVCPAAADNRRRCEHATHVVINVGHCIPSERFAEHTSMVDGRGRCPFVGGAPLVARRTPRRTINYYAITTRRYHLIFLRLSGVCSKV